MISEYAKSSSERRGLWQLESVVDALRFFAYGNSRVAIASHLNVHRNTVTRWLRGVSRLDPQTVSTVLGSEFSELAKRLACRAVLREDTGCWQWVGASDTGSTTFRHCDRRWLPHRLIWSLVHEFPARCVGRSCGTSTCFNPDHLIQGRGPYPRLHRDRIRKMDGRLTSVIPPGMYEWRGKLRPL